MTEPRVIDLGEWSQFEKRSIAGPACELSVRVGGAADGPVVLFDHSILTSSAVWSRQALLLAGLGFRVLCPDMRGHGDSDSASASCTMDDLVADNIAVLDALGVERVHFVGVSQGGMIGFGMGARHPERLSSLFIVAARADAPAPFAAAWDDRIALVNSQHSVDSLARPTAERWFGTHFIESNSAVADVLIECILQTSADGFVGCARAIQGLNYLSDVSSIKVPTALVIGQRDTLLLQPMRDLAPILRHASLHEIEDAGHLPQLDQPDAFDAILRTHLQQVAALP